MQRLNRKLILVTLMFSLVGASLNASTAAAATNPSTWRTWHLESADQFRLTAPPKANSRKTRRELRQLRRLKAERTPAIRRSIKKWNRGPATLPWTDAILELIPKDVALRRPGFSARALAVFHTAMYDAMVAAADSKKAYAGRTRPKPVKLDPRIKPLLGGKRGSSYAPVQAAVAGAAEETLKYLFPGLNPADFTALADEAVRSRLYAGANYRSDVVRARKLGREVAGEAIANAQTDLSDSTGFPHPVLEGEAYWSPTSPTFTPPISGPLGKWRPWLMDEPGQLRGLIPPPYEYASPEFMAETLEVIEVTSHPDPIEAQRRREIAFFWDDGVGTATPPGHWFQIASDLVRTPGEPGFALDTNQTARAFALLGATVADAAIAAWEAKYYWWSIRPITVIWRLCEGDTRFCTEEEASSDPVLAPRYGVWDSDIVTPAFPSYPGGHSTFSGSAGKILSYFFPDAGESLNQQAEEAAVSRLYGGIHFRSDNDAGLVLGRAIADLAIERAQSDGSDL